MMSERKGSTSDKNKGGKPQQKAAEDQGEPPDVPESPIQVTSKAAAITAASSSTQGEDTRDSVHSQQTLNGREEADGGESSQASGKRKLSKKEKKEEGKLKKEKEKERKEQEKKERKDREVKEWQERKKEEAARQQRARSASQSKRKKTSQSTPPPLSPNEAHLPQRRHTHSEGSQASQVFTNTQDSILKEKMKKVSESSDLQGTNISVGPETGEDLQLKVEELNDEIEFLKSQNRKTIEILKAEKDIEIGKLKEEKEQLIAEVSEALDHQKLQEVERVETQKQKLKSEIETLQEEEIARHQKNIAEIISKKAELERIQKEFDSKHSEVEKLRNDSEAAKDKHTNELETLKAEHAKVLTDLQREKEQTLREKENENDLQLKVEELNDEIEFLKSQNRKTIEILKAEKDIEIGKLKEEKEQLIAEVSEALDHQKLQEVERVETQKQKLKSEIETLQEEEIARHQKNIAKIISKKAELERIQKEFDSKHSEVEKLRKDSEAAKDKHTNELETLKAEHAKVLTDLQREKEQTLREKENETEQWRRKSKQVEEEIAELRMKLKENKIVLEDDDTCPLPSEAQKQEIQRLKTQLEETVLEYKEEIAKMSTELDQSRKELAVKADEACRLSHELDGAKAKAKELQTDLARQHAEEIDLLKADYEEKRKNDEQLMEQQLQTKLNQREIASKDRRLNLKKENEELKEQLKQFETRWKEKEHEHKVCIDSMKSTNERKQKGYERQLQEKTDEIKSLNDQLNNARTQHRKVDKESERLKQELLEKESELAKVGSARDELSSKLQDLQCKYDQLGVEVKLKKHETAATEWIQSSGDDDNLTYTEKADLQGQLTEAQEEILKRDQRIRELEHQLLHVKQSMHEDLNGEQDDQVEGASDVKEKVVPYSKFAKVRYSYIMIMEKLTMMEEKHEKELSKMQKKHDKEKKELMEKLDDCQKHLEDERQMPRTHHSFSGEDREPVKDMDRETAVREVSHLRIIVDEIDKQVSSLKTQLQSFDKTAAERQKLEKHTKEQSRTVMDWRKKFEAAEVGIKQLKQSKEELVKKVDELEEHEVSQKEFQAEKLSVKREKERVQELEVTIVQLRHEIEHLQEQLRGYDSMHQEVKDSKGNASALLKRFKSLLGKSEADCSMSYRELTKKLDDLKSELEAQKLQAWIYKEDFEAERKDREKAAGEKDEKIALYSQACHEDRHRQLTNALDDLAGRQKELEDTKRLLQETIDDAAKNLQEFEERHAKEMEACIEDAENIVKRKQQEMKAGLARLNENIAHLEKEQAQILGERDHLRENRDKLKRERDDFKKQVQELCGKSEVLNDQRKAKEKEAELYATKKNELENELRQIREQLRNACTVKDSLQAEVVEVKQQLSAVLAAKAALTDESLAKTQQVKQYKKQVDNFRVQLQESCARIEQYQMRLQQYESELAYCQWDLQTRKEDSESKVTLLYRRMKDSNCLLQQQLQWVNQQMKRFVAKVDGKLTPFNIGPLQLLRHVGQGSYGCVYTAKVEGTTCIAKRLHDILVSVGREDRKQYNASVGRFQQECLLLSQVRHPNIVQFMGVHYTEQDPYNMTLLMERLPVDLGQCIGKCHTENYELALGIKISILVDICNGLSYLHSEDKSKKSIIHRDLSASNILLTPDMQAKIADLGVSKILSNHSRWSQQLSKAPGAHGYMPPEALKDPPDYDCKLDVFSFGVIALYVAVQEYPDFLWERVPDHIFTKGEGEQWKRKRWISKMGDKHSLAPVICKCLLIKERRPNTEYLKIMLAQLQSENLISIEDTLDCILHLNALLKLD